MATEAQRLIGISLTKIAQSRAHRGGVSLHKNLLVATVLQKARYIFMEEAYHMVHGTPPALAPSYDDEDSGSETEELVALTPEEAGIGDKENVPPHQSQTELTYFDLDKSVFRNTGTTTGPCLKRRRAVTEWETEEAVLSILPKCKQMKSSANDEDDDSVFVDDALFADSAKTASATTDTASATTGSTMEIDRITSLVSIFSFGSLSRAVSTPDLCSAQAMEADALQQQRPYLAMTV